MSFQQRQIQDVDKEQKKKVRGFREVIDLICSSLKPVVSHNSLSGEYVVNDQFYLKPFAKKFFPCILYFFFFLQHSDLTFIHSKFLAPLPPSMDEFTSSLELSFPLVIDVNHLMKEVGAERKVTSIPVAAAYLKNHFFAPTEVEIPCQGELLDHEFFHMSKICQHCCNFYASLVLVKLLYCEQLILFLPFTFLTG